MTELSVELVPRSPESLDAQLHALREAFPGVRTINVPDQPQFDVRSWDACARGLDFVDRAIPHVRAISFEGKRPFPLRETLLASGISDLLVVHGDAPAELRVRVFPTTSVELIRSVREALPDARIFAAFDPYRAGLRDELRYAHEKLEAGASGLFTQPFFDLRLMQICHEQLADIETWWGLSPVTTARSRRYWETKNRTFFPETFEPSLEWNRRFARDALEWAYAVDTNLYFMPIRVDLVAYLEGILE